MNARPLSRRDRGGAFLTPQAARPPVPARSVWQADPASQSRISLSAAVTLTEQATTSAATEQATRAAYLARLDERTQTADLVLTSDASANLKTEFLQRVAELFSSSFYVVELADEARAGVEVWLQKRFDNVGDLALEHVDSLLDIAAAASGGTPQNVEAQKLAVVGAWFVRYVGYVVRATAGVQAQAPPESEQQQPAESLGRATRGLSVLTQIFSRKITALCASIFKEETATQEDEFVSFAATFLEVLKTLTIAVEASGGGEKNSQISSRGTSRTTSARGNPVRDHLKTLMYAVPYSLERVVQRAAFQPSALIEISVQEFETIATEVEQLACQVTRDLGGVRELWTALWTLNNGVTSGAGYDVCMRAHGRAQEIYESMQQGILLTAVSRRGGGRSALSSARSGLEAGNIIL